MGFLLTLLTSALLVGVSQAATGPDPPTIKFADSNLQIFPPSEAKGKISGAYRPPTDADGQIRSPTSSSSH